MIGVAVLIFGAIFRYKLLDTPLFSMLQKERKLESKPALELFKKNWKTVIGFAFAISSIVYIAVGIQISVVQSRLITVGHYSSVFANSTVLIAYIGFLITAIIFGALSDKYISRKKLVIVGLILALLFIYPYFSLVLTNDMLSVLMASFVLGAFLGMPIGALYAWFAESFPTQYRYSGAGLSYQIGGLIAGVMIVFVIPAILLLGGTSAWWALATTAVGISLIGVIAAALLKDTQPNKPLMVS